MWFVVQFDGPDVWEDLDWWAVQDGDHEVDYERHTVSFRMDVHDLIRRTSVLRAMLDNPRCPAGHGPLECRTCYGDDE